MPMKIEQIDKLMEELVLDGTTEGRKSVILNDLRKDYSEGLNWMEENEGVLEKAKAENKALKDANLRLFKAGNSFQEVEKPKTLGQTITLEAIEQKYRVY